MIKLIIKGKEKVFSNKKGLERLRKSNPNEIFRLAKCYDTQKFVIQVWHTEDKEWICLHD